MSFGQRIEAIDNLVWGPWLLGLLLGTGLYLTLLLRFLPLRRIKTALGYAIGKSGQNGEHAKAGKAEKSGTEGSGRISPFSSLMTELAATIGTGNIVGVASAMVLGGPGALFWMVATSLIGMATKLTESTLSVKYRAKNESGQTAGGPMYVCIRAFPHRRSGRILAYAFALFAVFASFGMGNMVQANSIADALFFSFRIPRLKCGLVLTLVTVLVVLGGIGIIGKVTQVFVPFMGIFYMLGTLSVIVYHWRNVPAAVAGIVTAAFCPAAVSGGVFGQVIATTFDSFRWGISRGIFSNEAGLGAAGITAAAADTEDAVKQGYVSMTGVFFDTVIICTATGLAIAASGVMGSADGYGRPLAGTELVMAAFGTVFGDFGGQFIGICMVLFAFATIIGWAYQGEKAFEFLMRGRTNGNLAYRFVYGSAVFAGCLFPAKIVWNLSDIFNGLMAVPNLLCVLALSVPTCAMIREYQG